MKQRIGVCILICLFLFSNTSIAQAPPPPQPQENQQIAQPPPKTFGPKKQATVIIFAGLGGAVLGLSTLSFYGRPQDKLANIAIGAAVGIIVGTIYVTYKAATQPGEFYGEQYRGTMIENPNMLSVDHPELIVGHRWEF